MENKKNRAKNDRPCQWVEIFIVQNNDDLNQVKVLIQVGYFCQKN